MYPLDSTFKTEKNKASNQPIFLYLIEKYNGVDDLPLAEWDTDITYPTSGGVTYTKFPIKHDQIGENSQGEIDTFKVTVSNINRTIQAYIEANDLRGKKVTLTLVWANQLADADAHIDFVFYIDTYSANQDTVEFTLSSKYDIIDLDLPAGKYNRNYCRWKFLSPECGYTTPESSCDKRKDTCKNTMNNIARYGGFPSVPTTRIYT